MNKSYQSPYPSPSRHSNTYYIASQSDTALPASTPASLVPRRKASDAVPYYSPHNEPRAQTVSEQYWAARALRAEALLSAGANHKLELRQTTLEEEAKRKDEIAALRAENAQRIYRLELVVLILMTALLALASALACALAFPQQKPVQQSRWIPSHFTIPILSPFASVVENETSVMSTRLIVTSLVVVACLAYAMFRHWLARHTKTTP